MKLLVAVIVGTGILSAVHAGDVEVAHKRLIDEFLRPEGLLCDYVGEIPTPKDCEECRPNAMGWWSPIENGPMFTGPYLKACVNRALRLKGTDRFAAAKAECAKMAAGLVRAASVSDVPGMIVRGFGTDGKCHYPLGSTDQTLPWFYGLHAYVMSELPDAAEKAAVTAKMTEVAKALEANDWGCPCDGKFKGENRGSFRKEGKLVFRVATHAMYLFAAMHEVTGDGHWLELYRAFRDRKLEGSDLTGAEVCEAGWRHDAPHFGVESHGMWIYVCAQGCLAELARMEKGSPFTERFRRGLRYNAERARLFLAKAKTYDNRTEKPFRYANWRPGYRWREQPTQKVAGEVAFSGIPEVLGSRKGYERMNMTIPLSAAAICAFAGEYVDEVAAAIGAYDYREISISEFFLAEVAWFADGFRMRTSKPQAGGTVTVHVDSERGDDAGDGGAEHPFRTPERARTAVRRLKAQPDFTGAEIVLRGDFAYPEGSFELTAEDGGLPGRPVVWRAEPGQAVFSGAITLKASDFVAVTDAETLSRLRPEARGKVKALDVAAWGIRLGRQPDAWGGYGQPGADCELYHSGGAGRVARYPNDGWLTFRFGIDRGILPADKSVGREFDIGVKPGTLPYPEGEVAPMRWMKAKDAFLFGYFCMDWYTEAIRIASIDTAKRSITLAAPAKYGIGHPPEWDQWVGDRRYYAFNLLEELDEPGEWYLDRDGGRLYYYPVDDGEVAFACGKKPVITVKGAEHLVLKNLTVRYSAAENAVSIAKVKDMLLEGLDVAWVLNNGVKAETTTRFVLAGSHIHHIGKDGLDAVSGDRRTLTECGSRVTECEFDHCGRIVSMKKAANIGGCGWRFDRNRMHDLPYIALVYSGNEHRIDHNEIWCAMMEGGDGGAVYTGRDWGSRGNVVSDNYIHHLGAAGARWRRAKGLPAEFHTPDLRESASTMGVYLDDCDAGDIVERNVFEETGYGAFVGGGRDNLVRDNIMIRCDAACHIDTRGLQRARPGKGIPNDSWDLLAKIEKFDFRASPWKDRYPELLTYMDKEPLLPLGTEFTGNTAIDCRAFFSESSKKGETAKVIRRLKIEGNRVFGAAGAAEMSGGRLGIAVEGKSDK